MFQVTSDGCNVDCVSPGNRRACRHVLVLVQWKTLGLLVRITLSLLLLLHPWVRQPPSNEQKTARRFCCTFWGLQGPMKWYNEKKGRKKERKDTNFRRESGCCVLTTMGYPTRPVRRP